MGCIKAISISNHCRDPKVEKYFSSHCCGFGLDLLQKAKYFSPKQKKPGFDIRLINLNHMQTFSIFFPQQKSIKIGETESFRIEWVAKFNGKGAKFPKWTGLQFPSKFSNFPRVAASTVVTCCRGQVGKLVRIGTITALRFSKIIKSYLF